MLPKNMVLDDDRSPKDLEELSELLQKEWRVEFLRTSLERLELSEQGVVRTPHGEFRVTRDFLEVCAAAIEMPMAYAYRIEADLFRENFDRRRRETTRPVTLCTMGDVVIGMVIDRNSRYRPASTLQVLESLKSCGIIEQLALRRASISHRGVDIELVRKDITVEPVPGDVIEVGLALSNSESGGRQLKASGYSYRLACTNGAVMRDSLGVARWPNDPRMTEAGCMAKFQKELQILCANVEDVVRLYANVNARVIPDSELCNLWRRVARILGVEEADSVVGISADERRDLQQTIRRRGPNEPAMATTWNAYSTHNRITHAAHGRRHLTRRGLQEIGGDLLSRALTWPFSPSVN
jgi:hypothetical protein